MALPTPAKAAFDAAQTAKFPGHSGSIRLGNRSSQLGQQKGFL